MCWAADQGQIPDSQTWKMSGTFLSISCQTRGLALVYQDVGKGALCVSVYVTDTMTTLGKLCHNRNGFDDNHKNLFSKSCFKKFIFCQLVS